MSTRRLPRWGIAIAVATSVVGVGVAVSAAATTRTSSPPVFYACLKGGTLSRVSNRPVTCGAGYRSISWNQQGPRLPSPESTFQAINHGTTLSGGLAVSEGSWIISDTMVGMTARCDIEPTVQFSVLADGMTGTTSNSSALVEIGNGGGTLDFACTGITATSGAAGLLVTAVPTLYESSHG